MADVTIGEYLERFPEACIVDPLYPQLQYAVFDYRDVLGAEFTREYSYLIQWVPPASLLNDVLRVLRHERVLPQWDGTEIVESRTEVRPAFVWFSSERLGCVPRSYIFTLAFRYNDKLTPITFPHLEPGVTRAVIRHKLGIDPHWVIDIFSKYSHNGFLYEGSGLPNPPTVDVAPNSTFIVMATPPPEQLPSMWSRVLCAFGASGTSGAFGASGAREPKPKQQ
jgi:hypothetical protein